MAAAAIATALIWWQANKKKIIKGKIENAVAKGTDSVYKISYDSSNINAAAGSAAFYNVLLQSDSLQQKLYSSDTTATAATIFNVRIKRIAVLGLNVPAFLQQNKIAAGAIEIEEPVFKIINTGKHKTATLSAKDTLALYEQITGKFKSIQAGSIKIINGTVYISEGRQEPTVQLSGINISLNNLKIDSTRNYDNIISYFINDVLVKIKTAVVKNVEKGRKLTFDNIEYNAFGKFLKVEKLVQTEINSGRKNIELNNNSITGLSTTAFIRNRQIKADAIATDGGTVNFYRTKNQKKKKQQLDIDNDFFDEAFVKNVNIGSTNVFVYDKTGGTAAPLSIKNVKFNASDIDSIYDGTNIMRLFGGSKWTLGADGFSLLTKDNLYKIVVAPLIADAAKGTINIKQIDVLPMLSQQAFVRSLKKQKDYFSFAFKNIILTGADVKAMITDNRIIVANASLEPVLKIFNDRTVPPDEGSKVGKYPHQLLQQLDMPVYIKKLNIKNGLISYKERGAISRQVGDVFFTAVNASVTNITNMPDFIKQNKWMQVEVTSKFLNKSLLASEWRLPLTALNQQFSITGSLASIDGRALNPVIEPLGMGSVNKGNISSLKFNITGDDYKSNGGAVLLYNNLKIKLLKPGADSSVKNKTVTSFFANIIIKDNNPSSTGKIRTGSTAFTRVQSKSFFNLVWKSIFAGVKDCVK